jgi:hypothetical protein
MAKFTYTITITEDDVGFVNSCSSRDDLHGHQVIFSEIPEKIKEKLEVKILAESISYFLVTLEKPFLSYF